MPLSLSRLSRAALIILCVAALSFTTSGCSASAPSRAAESLSSTVVVEGVTRQVAINAPADQSQIKALVLVIGGAQADAFVKDSVNWLVDAQYATLTIEGADEMHPEQLAQAFNSVAGNYGGSPLPQAPLAFGSAGPLAWKSLALDSGAIESAFLVSCPLPKGDFDFRRLRETSIRAIFAEGGDVYESSYERAHVPMREIPTPHDFLIFGGGVADTYYDRASPSFHQATWDATLKSMSGWFDIWAAGGSGAGPSHPHAG